MRLFYIINSQYLCLKFAKLLFNEITLPKTSKVEGFKRKSTVVSIFDTTVDNPLQIYWGIGLRKGDTSPFCPLMIRLKSIKCGCFKGSKSL